MCVFQWSNSREYGRARYAKPEAQLRRETTRSFVSLNILLGHSRLLKVIWNGTLEKGVCKSLLVFHWNYVCISHHYWDSLTHSLLCLTSEGRSDLHNERSCADDHSELIVHPWSSSTCYIQVFLGRPGGRFQLGAGHLPCERLTQCLRILWAGTSGGRWQRCPSNECLLSAMMRGRSISFVWLRTESLVTKSYHFLFRIYSTHSLTH